MTIPKTVDIILGSGSPRRQSLLEQIKIKHRVELRTIDEKFDPVLQAEQITDDLACLLYTSPSPRDGLLSRMPSSA